MEDYAVDRDMVEYLDNYGRHFNRRLYEFAVSKMYRVKANGIRESIKPLSKEAFESRMASAGISLENDVLCDGMYVMSMCESDYLGSSVPDEKHMCLFVRDTIDDVDQADGFVFNRFLASMRLKGTPIDWYSMI